jgi:hypothetical protein
VARDLANARRLSIGSGLGILATIASIAVSCCQGYPSRGNRSGTHRSYGVSSISEDLNDVSLASLGFRREKLGRRETHCCPCKRSSRFTKANSITSQIRRVAPLAQRSSQLVRIVCTQEFVLPFGRISCCVHVAWSRPQEIVPLENTWKFLRHDAT